MNDAAPSLNTRLYNVRMTRRFVNGLASMKGLSEEFSAELSRLDDLWSEALASRAPATMTKAREYEAALLRHITHVRES